MCCGNWFVVHAISGLICGKTYSNYLITLLLRCSSILFSCPLAFTNLRFTSIGLLLGLQYSIPDPFETFRTKIFRSLLVPNSLWVILNPRSCLISPLSSILNFRERFFSAFPLPNVSFLQLGSSIQWLIYKTRTERNKDYLAFSLWKYMDHSHTCATYFLL